MADPLNTQITSKASGGPITPRDVDIPIAYLRECLSYDPVTGELTWRERPLVHFGANRNAWATWNALWAGKPAGSICTKGYRQTELKIGGQRRRVLIHRAVFALVNGTWPTAQVDHKNRNKLANKPENLREATNAQNHQNMGPSSNNKSGVKGVQWNTRNRRWIAIITVKGHQYHLGSFVNKGDAIKVRLAAQVQLHPFADVSLPHPPAKPDAAL